MKTKKAAVAGTRRNLPDPGTSAQEHLECPPTILKANDQLRHSLPGSDVYSQLYEETLIGCKRSLCVGQSMTAPESRRHIAKSLPLMNPFRGPVRMKE
jgi:hypothetical protein